MSTPLPTDEDRAAAAALLDDLLTAGHSHDGANEAMARALVAAREEGRRDLANRANEAARRTREDAATEARRAARWLREGRYGMALAAVQRAEGLRQVANNLELMAGLR